MAKGGDFVGFVHAAVQDRDVIAAIAQPVRDRHARRAASPDQQGLHMRDSQAARPCIMSWLSCAPSLLSGTGRSRWKKPLSAASHSGSPGSSRSEEHTSELQSLMRSSYAVFCLKKKNTKKKNNKHL